MDEQRAATLPRAILGCNIAPRDSGLQHCPAHTRAQHCRVARLGLSHHFNFIHNRFGPTASPTRAKCWASAAAMENAPWRRRQALRANRADLPQGGGEGSQAAAAPGTEMLVDAGGGEGSQAVAAPPWLELEGSLSDMLAEAEGWKATAAAPDGLLRPPDLAAASPPDLAAASPLGLAAASPMELAAASPLALAAAAAGPCRTKEEVGGGGGGEGGCSSCCRNQRHGRH